MPRPISYAVFCLKKKTWPDLVISASMRNEPVCRWIRRHSEVRTRYVHIGNPWARAGDFDLFFTIPAYHTQLYTLSLHDALPISINASLNAATSTRAVSSNPNFVTD